MQMNNYDCIISELHYKIDKIKTSDELYHFLVEHTPFEQLRWRCRKCEKIYGICPDTLEDDQLCRERFYQWCIQETKYK